MGEVNHRSRVHCPPFRADRHAVTVNDPLHTRNRCCMSSLEWLEMPGIVVAEAAFASHPKEGVNGNQ